MARREGRSDVTALPYGPSVPHMFIVVFLVMLPTYLKTNDPILAWQAGLAWAFIIGIIILLGAFVGPTIRKYTPRAAMLGALAGISIAFISMRPAALSWEVPWLAFISLGIILVSWTARVRLPWGLPGGLAAVAVGTVLAWLATATGISAVMDPHAVVVALHKFGLHVPIPSADFLAGLSDIGPLLVVAVPLGVYNFTEGMNNVESASAAGDNFDLRKVLLADGIGALAGAVLGSPFPPAVYIGHPGWKSVGGRIGYSFATGIVISLVCFLGLTALLLAVVPLVTILPILLYIGLVIGAQAFETTPVRHAPAVILAMLPNIASWAQSQIDGALAAAGTSAAQVGLDKLAGNGVIYHGLQLFGGGGTLAGLMLGAIAAFIIDRKFDRAALSRAADRQDQSRPVRHRPRRYAQSVWCAAQCLRCGLRAGRLFLRFRLRGRSRHRPLCTWYRHRRLGPHPGGLRQHRRPEADARQCLRARRGACMPLARHHLGVRFVCRCGTRGAARDRGVRRRGPVFACGTIRASAPRRSTAIATDRHRRNG